MLRVGRLRYNVNPADVCSLHFCDQWLGNVTSASVQRATNKAMAALVRKFVARGTS